ncbi:MBL fold metallo-hydrolase [uncultured Friedmanniella sp.]|uniref:MBL fold metallo-hydrolase n=1 Tax=uncultured Friedmanniella sp. TaxID=335381 RepID=UPI0035CA5A8D
MDDPATLALSPWREVADGVYVAVAEPARVNLGLVVGSTGALLVDTGSTPDQGRQLRESVASVTDRPLRAVILTHWHHDHAFGLGAFPDVPTLAHESVADRLVGPEALVDAAELGLGPDELRLPSRGLAVAASIDLGDRRVEVAHLGAGHTEGDLLVVVPDADLLFVGDLLESAGPPWYGPDSRPHEWAATLDGVIGLMTAGTRAVPGHGQPVDREFAFEARGRVAAVSGELIRLVDAGVAEADALAAGDWPYPSEQIAAGIAPGYAALAGRGVKGVRPILPLA